MVDLLGDFSLDKNKITVTLIFEDKESKVSWSPNETSLKEAKFMFLCTCDALADCDFEVLDMQAKPINVNKLTEFTNNSVFFLRKTNTNKVSNLLLDGRRRLYVEIEPLKHIEAQVAIKYMCIGSNLLKHTQKGFPHIRLFQLSNDLQRILWYTKSKKINEAQVLISSIKDLTLGQISETFTQYPLKMLEDFSFSIYYNKNNAMHTLDITCKDIQEFDLWVIGIKALHSNVNHKIISKNDLLNHSKSYNEQIKKGNIGSCTKFLFYKPTGASSTSPSSNKELNDYSQSKTLDNFLLNRELSPYAISQVFLRLNNKLQTLRGDIEEYSNKDIIEVGQNDNDDGDGDGYAQVFDEEAIVDDLDTQKTQMMTLFSKCEKGITDALDDFFAWYEDNKYNSSTNISSEDREEFNEIMSQLRFHYDSYLPSKSKKEALDKEEENDNEEIKAKVNSEFFMKELDIRTWKIEVDLENVGDILNRFKCLKNKGFVDTMKNLFKGLVN